MNEIISGVDISVIVPVYGCDAALLQLADRVRNELRRMERSYELILVDDCGPGRPWELITELAGTDPAVRGVRMSRNFGQHAAITAGLAQATGRWAVVMDCDLQDPPEEIHRLLEKATAGYDIVYARRKNKQHSWPRRTAARAYFGLMQIFTRQQLDGEYGSFSIISRRVIDAFLRFRDKERHYLLILHWLGFPNAFIEYEHSKRLAGRSSYTLASLIGHALSGMFFQTTVLLRWIVYTGFIISMGGILLAVYFIYLYFSQSPLPGWTSLAVLVLVLGGFILTSIGIVGLYIGRIFDQVKDRPLYIVQDTVGGSSE